MRVARVEHEGQIRTAVVSSDGTSVGLLPHGITPIEALTTEQHPTEDTPIADVRLMAPVEPPTIRDFSVFEQHMEGVRKNFDPNATVPDVFYASPFCYFSNPHALTGPNDEISGTCGFGCLLELLGRFGRDCHQPLGPGDTVELSVQGVGTLTNTVVAGVDSVPLPTARRVDYSTER